MWKLAGERGRRVRAAVLPVLETVVPLALVGSVLVSAYNNYLTGPRPLDVTGAALILLANLPVLVRRRAPVTVLVLCCAGTVAFAAWGYWEALNASGTLIAVYTVAVYRSHRVSVLCCVAGIAAAAYAGVAVGGGAAWLLVLLPTAYTVTAWALGDTRRQLILRNEQLAELTEQLNRDREARARHAVAQDRIRIARDLHDVVAHHMSVVSVQAGLARYVFESDPATAVAALRTIGTASSDALAEMRLMLAVLRPDQDAAGDGASPAGAVRLDQLDVLAERVTAAGVPVTLTVLGTARPLPAGVETCAFRAVQESLTNTLKHAGPARAEVTVEYRADQVVVRVADDGRGPAVPAGGAGGHGLVGMRERAGLYGGSVAAGARPGGGFQVEVTLPTPAA